MLTPEEKHNTALAYADMLERIDRVLGARDDIVDLTSDKVHPSDWEAIVEREGDIVTLLGVFRIMLQAAAQAIDNDALTSHAQAVITMP